MSPAGAAQCTATTGVSVVVDFNHGAGGGVETACAPSGGGKYADAIFPAAGFPLEYAKGSVGFVCRVKSAPRGTDVCTQTAPADAYWGLFWAKRGARSWTYATSGVGGLRVPEGGAVAWAFQDGDGTHFPGPDPSQRGEPTPTPKPTKAPPKASSGGSGGGGGTKAATPGKAAATTATPATPTPTASARAAAKAKVKAKAKSKAAKASARASATASASASASETVSPPSEDSDATATEKTSGEFTPEEKDSGLPVWVPIVVLLGLGGAAGGAVWWRRRTGAA